MVEAPSLEAVKRCLDLVLGDVAEVAVAVLGAHMDSTFKESQNILSGERPLRIMESNSSQCTQHPKNPTMYLSS